MQDYIDIIQEAENRGQFAQTRSGLAYYQRTKGWISMNDQRQSFGAMLALGVHAQQQVLESWAVDRRQRRNAIDRITRHKKLAEDLTETFRLATQLTEKQLPPEDLKVNLYSLDRQSSLGGFQGEAIEAFLAESYLVLYRSNHQEEKYRDYAWELAQSIIANGTSGQEDKLSKSMFLSATLKYLYLIFSGNETLVPMEAWVFNEAGQPLPICGADPRTYPVEKCKHRLMSYQEKLVAQFDL